MKEKYRIVILVFCVFIGLALTFFPNRFGWKADKDMVLIPEGEFLLGSNDIEEWELDPDEFGIMQDEFFKNERPVWKVFVKGFKIDKYEVTNKQFKLFVDKTNYPPPVTWTNGSYPPGKKDHSVNNVTWFAASKYCEWVGKRLPLEEEWEKVAKGPMNNRYPWGVKFDIKKGNFDKGDTVPVGSIPEDKSYYGVYDMAGNVMEWTGTWFNAYPGSTLKSSNFGKTNRVIRGWSGVDAGHYSMPFIFSRTTARHFYLPYGFSDDIGFRCTKDL